MDNQEKKRARYYFWKEDLIKSNKQGKKRLNFWNRIKVTQYNRNERKVENREYKVLNYDKKAQNYR